MGNKVTEVHLVQQKSGEGEEITVDDLVPNFEIIDTYPLLGDEETMLEVTKRYNAR